MCLPLFFSDSRTTTYNLFKLCHRVDALIKYNEFYHLTVHTSREKFTCRSNHRVFRRYGYEVVQLRLSVRVTACNANYIVWILFAHIRVFIDKSSTHPVGMVFVCTEYNGLCHSICAFQILSYLMCNFSNSIL